jgi:beta-lactamase regulating signal transducer with metallopeptidase domain
MNTDWAIRVVLAGILIFTAALAIDRALGWLNKPRRWMWLTAMVASISLPAVAANAPGRLPVFGIENSAPARTTGTSQVARAEVRGDVHLAVTPAVPAGAVSWRPSGLTLWVGASILLMISATSAGARLAMLRSRARDAVVDGIAVKLTHDLGPLVTGLFKPVILVPSWVATADPGERRMILAHEREHIAGGDHWLVPLAALLVISMPWNPVVWMMYRRLRLSVETDCDARVVARGVDLREYGATLLRIAGGMRHGILSPAWRHRARDLEHRVRELTAPLPRSPALRSALLSLGATIVIAVACDAAAPDTADSSMRLQSTPPQRPTRAAARPAQSLQQAPVRMQLVAAPSAPRQQALAPGFVRVTGYTREVLPARVTVTRGGGIEVLAGTRVIRTSGDTVVEFYTPGLFRIRGDQFKAVAEALESGTEVEIVGTHPGGGLPRVATARGTSPMLNFERGPTATGDSVVTMQNRDGTVAVTVITNEVIPVPKNETITVITNEVIPTLNSGEIRTNSESGLPVRILVRFTDGISFINGRAVTGLGAGEHEVETTTPVLVKLTGDGNLSVAFIAVDAGQNIKAYARGGPRTVWSELSGSYSGALVICSQPGVGGGITGYTRGTPLSEACGR